MLGYPGAHPPTSPPAGPSRAPVTGANPCRLAPGLEKCAWMPPFPYPWVYKVGFSSKCARSGHTMQSCSPKVMPFAPS